MTDIELVIKIPEEIYHIVINTGTYGCYRFNSTEAIRKGTPLPKGHGFIAICDSDFPITEEVKQELKNTVFVGNEDCRYCFDITEIIEADKAESEDEE